MCLCLYLFVWLYGSCVAACECPTLNHCASVVDTSFVVAGEAVGEGM